MAKSVCGLKNIGITLAVLAGIYLLFRNTLNVSVLTEALSENKKFCKSLNANLGPGEVCPPSIPTKPGLKLVDYALIDKDMGPTPISKSAGKPQPKLAPPTATTSKGKCTLVSGQKEPEGYPCADQTQELSTGGCKLPNCKWTAGTTTTTTSTASLSSSGKCGINPTWATNASAGDLATWTNNCTKNAAMTAFISSILFI